MYCCYELGYELVEPRPPRLSVRYVPQGAVHRLRNTAACEAAFLLQWLIEYHHGCINELRLLCSARPHDIRTQQAPVPIRLRPPPAECHIHKIRSLEVKTEHERTCEDMRRHDCCYLPDECIEAVRGLEGLKICSADGSMEPGLVKLLQRNSNSLKRVEISKATLSRRMAVALHRLEKCESMTVSLCSYDHESHVVFDPVMELVQSLRNAKNFRFGPPIAVERYGSALAEAPKTSETLTTPVF